MKLQGRPVASAKKSLCCISVSDNEHKFAGSRVKQITIQKTSDTQLGKNKSKIRPI